MDCHAARTLWMLDRPGSLSELDAGEAKALREHLSQCPDCADAIAREKRFDQAVAKTLRDVPIPADLQANIARKLSAEVRRPPTFGWVAAAAAVLMAFAGTGYWFFKPLPELTHEAAIAELDLKVAHDPDTIEAWFVEQGLRTSVPRQFNYQKLLGYDVVVFQNRRAARLTFFNPGEPATLAFLFVLPKNQFDVRDLPHHAPGTHFTLEVFQWPDLPDFEFLLATSAGGDRSALLRPGV